MTGTSEAGGAGGGMTEHYGVGPKAVEGGDGVNEALALLYRGALFGERDHVGPGPAGGELEGDGGARGGLEEGEADGLAGERAVEEVVVAGEVEHRPELGAARPFERE